uniref:Uncharacterized protein n=1 Tax=Xenopus tropicalis TaxID=8364 RepID=A0A1B8XTS9_XENTR
MDPNKNTSSHLGKRNRFRQQLNTAMTVFQNAIARIIGISSGTNPVAAPVGANAGVVTGSEATPSASSSGIKRTRSRLKAKPSTSTARADTQVSSSPVPSTSMASSSEGTGNIAGIQLPATDTRNPNISSSVAQKDNSSQQKYNIIQPNHCNVQNNATAPRNPSTTTRGIYEYIELRDRERAIQAHQQQIALQQQMEHLRQFPYEDSPLFRNPIPETRKRKLHPNPGDVALWNPKRLRLRLGKGPRVHPKALETKTETQNVQCKEDCTSDDIFQPRSVIIARLRARAQERKRKELNKPEQSEKKDDFPSN